MDEKGGSWSLGGENDKRSRAEQLRRQQMPRVYVCLALPGFIFIGVGLFALFLSRLHVWGVSRFWQLMNPAGYIFASILTVLTVVVYLAMSSSDSPSNER
jgi:NADH:ubiquinone oxidoreductase subunit 5 (subunit L)/multisubunit Na+/H+ antiporter MnhA subunit